MKAAWKKSGVLLVCGFFIWAAGCGSGFNSLDGLDYPPPDPTNLAATDGAATEIVLDWDSGGGSTSDYRISYASGATAPADCATGTQISESSITDTAHTVTGLTSTTSYSFRVCAINGNPTPNVSDGVTITHTAP